MLRKKINRILWFLILLYIFLVQSNYTDADIFAERIVEKNKFSVITLDFSTKSTFNNNTINNLFSAFGFLPEGFDIGAIKITNESTSNFKYYLKAIKISGDEGFCNKLELKILNQNLKTIYSGPLLSLNAKSNINDPKNNKWIFFISFDDHSEESKNKRCEFNFKFRTYREDINETGGIYAEREINNIISSGNW